MLSHFWRNIQIRVLLCSGFMSKEEKYNHSLYISICYKLRLVSVSITVLFYFNSNLFVQTTNYDVVFFCKGRNDEYTKH